MREVGEGSVLPTDGRHARRRSPWPIALGAGLLAVVLVAGIMVYAAMRAGSREGFKGKDVATVEPTQP
ncbi:xylan 1,4-beta-xylosidase, partial [Nonomuraea sp. NN258]|nr:xylan 1,4-beta-xylosidase [Nonomuraea antri]